MKVLFYPDPPIQLSGHTLSKTISYFQILGYELTSDINDSWDIAVHWNYKDRNETPNVLLNGFRPVLNKRLNNVTKSFVDKIFSRIFKYSSMADTSLYGYCVRKTERQSAHDGVIVRTPCEKEKGYIYQKMIDNRMNLGAIYDIRVPVFCGEIPELFIKSRTIEGTFENTLSPNKKYWTTSVEEYLSNREILKIKDFCFQIGLDIGELDVLRDNSTSLMYVIDVNNIPGGAVFNHLKDGDRVRERMAFFLKEQIEKWRT